MYSYSKYTYNVESATTGPRADDGARRLCFACGESQTTKGAMRTLLGSALRLKTYEVLRPKDESKQDIRRMQSHSPTVFNGSC